MLHTRLQIRCQLLNMQQLPRMKMKQTLVKRTTRFYTSNTRKIFSDRLDFLYDALLDIPGITCIKPSGAFYLFPNVKTAVLNNGFTTVDEWVTALLEEEKVALVPGSGFGSPDHVRLSYATSMELLEEAAKRIKRFVLKHQS